MTPSLNHGLYIEDTICSVLNQNYKSLEYVVVDGGSTDNSVDIIKRYSKNLKYWISEPDGGHGNALNKGFTQTTGEIMAWINSDDKYLPWTFEVVAEIFSAFPEVNWIVGFNAWWDNKGRMTHAERVYRNVYDYLLGNYKWIQQESVFWRRSLWDRAGGCINEDYKLMVDGELWCRFFRTDRLYTVDSILGGYRQHEENRALLHRDSCNAEMEKAITWLRDNCDRTISETSRVLQKIIALKRMPQPQSSQFPPETMQRFANACNRANYDRIAYLNGQWKKSKVKFHVC